VKNAAFIRLRSPGETIECSYPSSAATSAAAADAGSSNYLMDSLFRTPKGAKSQSSPEQSTAEVGRIFANATATGKLPEEDARYAAQVVSQRTGISQQEAEKRVNDTFAQIQAKKKEAQETKQTHKKTTHN